MLQSKLGRRPPGWIVSAGSILLCLGIQMLVFHPAGAYVRFDGGGKTGGGGPGLMRLDEEFHDVNAVILMVDNNGPIGGQHGGEHRLGFLPRRHAEQLRVRHGSLVRRLI